MIRKYLKHLLYMVCSFVIVILCINAVFTGLHDNGQVGMLAGLVLSPIVLIPILYKMKWWIKLMLIAALILIPFVVTKFTAKLLYTLVDEPIDFRIDLLSYLLFYILSLSLIELGLFVHKNQSAIHLKT